jgi:2'-5' RNA ligase
MHWSVPLMVRAFIAVEMDGAMLREPLKALRAFHDLKVVPEGNMHITLKFLGEVQDGQMAAVQEAIDRVAERPAFSFSVKGVGAFPSENDPRVIWAGTEGAEALSSMASGLEERLLPLGFTKEQREFSAHITLARSRDRGARLAYSGLAAFKETKFGTVAVDALRLKKSVLTPKGPIYSDLHVRRLGGQV